MVNKFWQALWIRKPLINQFVAALRRNFSISRGNHWIFLKNMA